MPGGLPGGGDEWLLWLQKRPQLFHDPDPFAAPMRCVSFAEGVFHHRDFGDGGDCFWEFQWGL